MMKKTLNFSLNFSYDPQVIDPLRFCLQTEEAIKTDFCVYFDSETLNIYLKMKSSVKEKPS